MHGLGKWQAKMTAALHTSRYRLPEDIAADVCTFENMQNLAALIHGGPYLAAAAREQQHRLPLPQQPRRREGARLDGAKALEHRAHRAQPARQTWALDGDNGQVATAVQCSGTCRGLACKASHKHGAAGATLQLECDELGKVVGWAMSSSVQIRCT
jgi:hypothetical protein